MTSEKGTESGRMSIEWHILLEFSILQVLLSNKQSVVIPNNELVLQDPFA